MTRSVRSLFLALNVLVFALFLSIVAYAYECTCTPSLPGDGESGGDASACVTGTIVATVAMKNGHCTEGTCSGVAKPCQFFFTFSIPICIFKFSTGVW